MHRLPRFVFITAPLTAAAFLTVQSPSASAQIELEVHLPSEDDPDDLIEIPDGDIRLTRFFNSARCECDSEFGVEFFIPDLTAVPDSRPIEVWAGNNCDDQELQQQDCGDDPIRTFGDRDALQNPVIERFTIRQLADPIDNECGAQEIEPRVYALLDETGDGTYEVNNTIGIFLDLNPPPFPDEPEARGSEGGFVVEWELPESRQDDFEFFQVLCANMDGTPALENPAEDAQYETPATVCNATVSIPGPDGGPGTEVTGIEALDPAYVCGGTVVPDKSIRVSSLPNNPEGYRVVLVAIDPARNPTAIDFGVVVPEPVQDFWEDYKDNGGGAEGGYCFIATATYGDYNHPHVVVLREFRDSVMAQTAVGRWMIRTYYTLSPPIASVIASSATLRFITRVVLAPIVVGAGLWVYSGLLGKLGLCLAFGLFIGLVWRRRQTRSSRKASKAPRRERTRARRPGRARVAAAAAAAVLVLVIATGSASAQQEYLDELTEDPTPSALNAPEAVRWNVEFRFAPFVPDVDSEFGGDGEGPFEEMFGGGPMLMSKMALDRFFLYPEGQLGVSFGVGFLTTGADAYAVDEMGNVETLPSGKKVRVEGERTNFRLFPFSVSGVYRYTGLDDRFNVPLVPYGKLGLAYTVWTITKPDGAAAEVPTMDCPDLEQDCDGDIARGGSLGFEATLGLAIRAERIDADASVSLRNEMGIEHAGFFVEVGYSKVDGFGSDSKLSVGDLTYFGGFNFEF